MLRCVLSQSGVRTNFRVSDAVAPVGLDSAPWFGWWVNSERTNEIQSAYRILVATSDELLAEDQGDVWDSGKVASRLQNHLALEGAALANAEGDDVGSRG